MAGEGRNQSLQDWLKMRQYLGDPEGVCGKYLRK
jgi:hypothetical protein